LQPRDAIAQVQPALLETAKAQLVDTGLQRHPLDCFVKIAVLDLQFDDTESDLLGIHDERVCALPAEKVPCGADTGPQAQGRNVPSKRPLDRRTTPEAMLAGPRKGEPPQPILGDTLAPESPYHCHVSPPQLKISAAIADHLGDRSEQQDRVALLTSERHPGTLLAVVADGMGGRTGGRLASDQVISTATNLFKELSTKDASLPELLRQIATEAHTVIRLTALSSEKEPHSTLAALIVKRGHAIWAHTGDSRIYFCRGGRVLARTTDHTVASQLSAEGRHAEAEIAAQRYKNVLFSALGIKHDLKIDVDQTEDLRVGDAFMLASDGLWAYFDDSEVASVLDRFSPRDASKHLVNLARERAEGRGDNISLAIVKLDAPAEAPLPAVPGLGDRA